MIEIKYIIMIGIAVCLLVLYYFYDDISNIKKSFVPMYQKTMELEAKVLKLESESKKITNINPKRKKISSKNESPAFSISYQSDMIGKGNLSVRYTDITESEANNLLKIVDQNKIKQLSLPHIKTSPNNNCNQQNNNISNCTGTNINISAEQLSDFDIPFDKTKNNHSSEAEIFGVKINDSVKNNNNANNISSNNINTNNNNPIYQKNNQHKLTTSEGLVEEYHEILDGLPTGIFEEQTIDQFVNQFDDDELDQDVIKSITESIRFADIPSETILSDINLMTKSVNKIKKK